jgi:hypothetical protein
MFGTLKGITSRFGRRVGHAIARILPFLMGAGVIAALILGWHVRDEDYLTPDEGLGYQLGIYGSTAMLALTFYSIRKRIKGARWLGSIPLWFRIHMILGVVGPVLIIFHGNFRLGALNSNVALFTMLTVASSGFVGRYLYGKVHIGVYGRRAEAKEILAEAEDLKQFLGEEMHAVEYVVQELNEFSRQTASSGPSGPLSSLWLGGVLAIRTRTLRTRVLAEALRLIRSESKVRGWSWWQRRKRILRVSAVVDQYCRTVRKAAGLQFYERLFALWHVLHLPLFFLMVVSLVIHVWAVHQY